MNDDVVLPVVSDFDVKIACARIDAIMASGKVRALRVEFADGVALQFGEFQPPKIPSPPVKAKAQLQRPKRSDLYGKTGYKYGTIAKLCHPWLKLAKENPGQPIILNSADFPGLEIYRVRPALAGMAVHRYGHGTMKTRVINGKSLEILYVGKE